MRIVFSLLILAAATAAGPVTFSGSVGLNDADPLLFLTEVFELDRSRDLCKERVVLPPADILAGMDAITGNKINALANAELLTGFPGKGFCCLPVKNCCPQLRVRQAEMYGDRGVLAGPQDLHGTRQTNGAEVVGYGGGCPGLAA